MMRVAALIPILIALCLNLDAQNTRHDVLDSAVVTDYRPRAEKKSQSSMLSISRKDFTLKSVLDSPDLIKTLQMFPGVTPGEEMSSTMNVRGGTGNDNLYILDNVPLYQAGHFLGLFSVFNTDVVESVYFYKGGFPAMYGGRASSVVDVRLSEGDMNEHHSTFSIGVTDGRFQIEGPIKKGVLSYNVALRHGWVEAFLKPILKVVDVPDVSYSNDYTKDGHYAFTDLNAKFTWLKGPRDKICFNAYAGYDFMSFIYGRRDGMIGGTQNSSMKEISKDANRWGNFLLAAVWDREFSARRKMQSTYYFTNGYYNALNLNKSVSKDRKYTYKHVESDISSVYDLGIKVDFTDRTFNRHALSYGASLVNHLFTPVANDHLYLDDEASDKYINEKNSEGSLYNSPELSVYAEDEYAITPVLYLNAGLRYMLFVVMKGVYNKLEPRLALSYVPSRAFSFKLAYTEMNQPVHQMESYENNYPGTYWMPATVRMKPMLARQWVAEAEWRPNHMLLLNVAGFWKDMRHLYGYIGSRNLPSPAAWETQFVEGRGRSSGFEFFGEFQNELWELSLGYTLSWTMRNFEAFYDGWYSDRYDNRHNIVFNSIYKAHRLVDMYATWTYRSGNRYTLPQYEIEGDGRSAYVPNNFQLPAYHRLDLGMNFRAKTKNKGHDYTVSFGVYNVYCRRNPVFIRYSEDVYDRPIVRMTSVFPILPSFRYSMSF
jgi:outer membrane receptor for ferrienterochelin and colicin